SHNGHFDSILSHRRAARPCENLANNARKTAALAISILEKWEDVMASTKKLIAGALIGALAAAPAARAKELMVPALEYRTGPYAPSGIPLTSGFSDYLTLLNERDGGIGGVKIKIAPCETSYDNKLGVECYEKTKQGALVFNPFSTGIT